MTSEMRIIGLKGPEDITPGVDLGAVIVEAAQAQGLAFSTGDIVVVTQKIVSKAEGRIVDLRGVEPRPTAVEFAKQWDRDARQVEVVLRESAEVLRMERGLVISRTHHGFVCANAGVDESNSGADGVVVLLPVDPDASARRIAAALRERSGRRVAVIVTDTFGRPWRQGLVDFALGVAGMSALLDLRGSADLDGRELHHTVNAQGDALAAAAGLVMRKGAGIPAALVRGYPYDPADGSGRELIREKQFDMFR